MTTSQEGRQVQRKLLIFEYNSACCAYQAALFFDTGTRLITKEFLQEIQHKRTAAPK